LKLQQILFDAELNGRLDLFVVALEPQFLFAVDVPDAFGGELVVGQLCEQSFQVPPEPLCFLGGVAGVLFLGVADVRVGGRSAPATVPVLLGVFLLIFLVELLLFEFDSRDLGASAPLFDGAVRAVFRRVVPYLAVGRLH
jgi:hypothetical protein